MGRFLTIFCIIILILGAISSYQEARKAYWEAYNISYEKGHTEGYNNGSDIGSQVFVENSLKPTLGGIILGIIGVIVISGTTIWGIVPSLKKIIYKSYHDRALNSSIANSLLTKDEAKELDDLSNAFEIKEKFFKLLDKNLKTISKTEKHKIWEKAAPNHQEIMADIQKLENLNIRIKTRINLNLKTANYRVNDENKDS
jgi:hypothetical protein